jgi:phage terminase small subunit
MGRVTLTRSAALREELLKQLPLHGFSLINAAIAAGYSPSYAKTTLPVIIRKNPELCQRINQLREATQATRGDKIDKLITFLENTVDDSKAALRDKLKAADSLAKIHGIYSETRVIETSQRQGQLSQAEQDEAKRLLSLRFDTSQGYGITPGDTHKSLPGGDIATDSDIIDANPEPNAMQSDSKAAPNGEQSSTLDGLGAAIDGAGDGGIERPLPPNDGAERRSPVPSAKNLPVAKGTRHIDNATTWEETS